MSRPYLQHGRRHAPGGSDPIPGLAGGFATSWIFGSQIGITVPSQASPATQVDLTDTTNYTNDADSFAIVTSDGLTINKVGFYLAFVSCLFAAAGGTVGTPAEVVWNLSGIGDALDDQGPFMSGISGTNALVRAFQGFPVDPSSVGTAAPLALKQVSGVSASVHIQFSVVRLTDDIGNY